MFSKYSVEIEPFAERHFIKRFQKKYKDAWSITWQAILEELKRIDSLLKSSVAEIITGNDKVKIIKTEFRVVKTHQSRHGSGNRCIVAVHKDTQTVYILLVYHKDDLGKGKETERWKRIIRENYQQYKDLF